MSKIIDPNNPNPVQMNKLPMKEKTQADINVILEKIGINVKFTLAYHGHLWKEDVGDIRVGFVVQDINPPKESIIIS